MGGQSPLKTAVDWVPTGDTVTPWRAEMGFQLWEVRVNDFPEENLYTLLVDGEEVESFDDWPASWRQSSRAHVSETSRRV